MKQNSYFFFFRYNKCSLDEINEAGICTKSIEEVHSFTIVTSPPVGTSLIKAVAIGTSHMAAVTGRIRLVLPVTDTLVDFQTNFSKVDHKPHPPPHNKKGSS